MNFLNKIKALYNSELLYRTFIVTQIFGLVAVCITDITSRNWDFLYISSYGFELSDFSLLDRYDWSSYPIQNYTALIGIFFPFPVTKAIDWILSSKEK